MPTMLLTRAEIEPLLQLSALLSPLREAFRAYSLERTIPGQRAHSPLPGEQPATAMLLFPGLVAGIPAYTVKVHAKYPTRQPVTQGVILLHELATGQLLAIMDSIAITAIRTGLAGALATDTLARPSASRVAIIGAGMQGRSQLRCLAHVRALTQARVYDTVSQRSEAYVQQMQPEFAFPILAAPSLAAAVEDAEIIISATWSHTPFLSSAMIQPGTHITTLGPDEPGKCEVDAQLIQQSLFVCDDRELAVKMGAIGGVGLGVDAVHAELGEIFGGTRAGRTSDEQITIYGGVGLAFQDLVASWHVYQAAQQQERKTLDFAR